MKKNKTRIFVIVIVSLLIAALCVVSGIAAGVVTVYGLRAARQEAANAPWEEPWEAPDAGRVWDGDDDDRFDADHERDDDDRFDTDRNQDSDDDGRFDADRNRDGDDRFSTDRSRDGKNSSRTDTDRRRNGEAPQDMIPLIGNNTSFQKDTVRSLDLELSAGELLLTRSSSPDTVELSATGIDGTELYCFLKNGTLYLIDRTPRTVLKPYLKNRAFEVAQVTVGLPEDFSLSEAEVEADAARLSIGEALRADRVEFSLDACELEADAAVEATVFSLDADASTVELPALRTQELQVESTVGYLSLGGSVSGSAQVESDAASVTLSLTGTAQQFNYRLEPSLGEITVDGQSYTREQTVDNGASAWMELETNVGAITVDFTE